MTTFGNGAVAVQWYCSPPAHPTLASHDPAVRVALLFALRHSAPPLVRPAGRLRRGDIRYDLRWVASVVIGGG